MNKRLSLVLAVVLASATPVAVAASPFVPAEALSYCVPVFDFHEAPDCAGAERLPSVTYNGKVVAPVPLPATSYRLVRDPISASWTMYTEAAK